MSPRKQNKKQILDPIQILFAIQWRLLCNNFDLPAVKFFQYMLYALPMVTTVHSIYR